MQKKRDFNGVYADERLDRIAYPLGGIGAGMICIEGNGALSHFSLRHKPDFISEPVVFSALYAKGDNYAARVLEGPLPERKVRGRMIGVSAQPGLPWLGDTSYLLPRCRSATFEARFPFATVRLADPQLPVEIEIKAWSPFIPGDSENSSLPVCGLIYNFTNTSAERVEAVYSFHAQNFMAKRPLLRRRATSRGTARIGKGCIVLSQAGTPQEPWEEGHFCAALEGGDALANAAWYRGSRSDALRLLWQGIESGACEAGQVYATGPASPGASLYLPFALGPGQSRTVNLLLSWYVPDSGFYVQGFGYSRPTPENPSYKPWYSARFSGIDDIARYWRSTYTRLLSETEGFTKCFYDTTLPDEVVEAVGANLTILKSPTIFRQQDGRVWCWEGSNNSEHFCFGSCTHVWNYAQALAHLFPDLERTLRQTEFDEALLDDGL